MSVSAKPLRRALAEDAENHDRDLLDTPRRGRPQRLWDAVGRTQVDMVLGDGARDQGALCDKIPDSTRGVGYVCLDGVREPTRVRAAYVTDQDIKGMVYLYAPRPGPGAGYARCWRPRRRAGDDG